MEIDYIIVIDKYEIASEQRREYRFTSPRLGRIGDIKDEVEIVNGKIKVTKKIESNGTGNYFPKSEPEILTPELKGIRNTVAGSEDDIILFKDINWITIKELHRDLQSNIYMKYLQNNSLNTALVTHSKMNSEIAILQGEINLKVSKDNLVAEINMQPEEIKIDAKNVNINGVLSANGNFEVDLEGNMICNNARVNGDLVTSQGVYTMLHFRASDIGIAVGNLRPSIGGFMLTGYEIVENSYPNRVYRLPQEIHYSVPNNFTIDYAYIEIRNKQTSFVVYNTSGVEQYRITGNLGPVEIWKGTGFNNALLTRTVGGQGGGTVMGRPDTRVPNPFPGGAFGYSFTNTGSVKTNNIASSLDSNGAVYVYPTTEYYPASSSYPYHSNTALGSTAYVRADLYIYGWIKR